MSQITDLDQLSSFDNSYNMAPLRSPVSRNVTYRSLAILTAINFFNYVDRYTIPGVLSDVESYYDVHDKEAGLINTAFIVVYMIFCPVFGYLGDRWTRKYLLMFGVLLWSLFVLCASFVPRNLFWLFLLLRAAVGIGEASYVTVAPIVIGDLFPEENRTLMLSICSLAIPAGSGFGYITGTEITSLAEQLLPSSQKGSAWKYSQRVTPFIGLLLVILTGFLVPEPKRGASEKVYPNPRYVQTISSLKDDLLYLIRNKSVVFATLGYVSVFFCTGSLAFWVPTFLARVEISKDAIAFKFGAIACAAGAFGVALGGFLAKTFRPRVPNADPLVCAWGVLISAPVLYFALVLVSWDMLVVYICTLIGMITLCLNWALVSKILIETVVPYRRSLASGTSNLTAHMFGDALSPFLVGYISSYLHNLGYTSEVSLQFALLINPLMCVCGAAAFCICDFFYLSDKSNCNKVLDDE